jgi:hypothetical protein
MSNGLFSKDTQNALDKLLSKEQKVPDQLYPLGTFVKGRSNNGFFIKTSISTGEKVHWVCLYNINRDDVVIGSYYESHKDDERSSIVDKGRTTKTPISADGYLIEPGDIFYYNFEGHVPSIHFPKVKIIASVHGRDVFVQRFGESDFNYLVVPSNRLLKKEY